MKRWFKRDPSLTAHLFWAVLLSVGLMLLDRSVPFFQPVRNIMSLSILPLQYIVHAPIRAVSFLTQSVTTQKNLVTENARLRAHELLLESRLQRLSILEQENEQLRELLKSTPQAGGRTQVAQLLAVSLDPNLDQVIIDRGAKQGVYVGQPVVDAYGVVGQVVDVWPLTSKVMLLTDPRSAIPVTAMDTGVRSIAVGLGSSGRLTLTHVPADEVIHPGDIWVSSGLGMRYPVGYPVAKVFRVVRDYRQRVQSVELMPLARLDQVQYVLLVWPSRPALMKAVEKALNAPIPTW